MKKTLIIMGMVLLTFITHHIIAIVAYFITYETMLDLTIPVIKKIYTITLFIWVICFAFLIAITNENT